jgi:hypothetical protein
VRPHVIRFDVVRQEELERELLHASVLIQEESVAFTLKGKGSHVGAASHSHHMSIPKAW